MLAAHMADIQAIVASGFAPLRHCTYWLLQVRDRQRARDWLDQVLQAGLVKSANDLGREANPVTGPHKHPEVVMAAFTAQGLAAFGQQQSDDYPFPAPFASGMANPARARMLGDDRVRAPWRWRDAMAGTGQRTVHLLVAHYRDDDHAAVGHGLLDQAALEGLAGFRVVDRVQACPSYVQEVVLHGGRKVWNGTEPFGFRDGIAQPAIAGFRESQADMAARRAVGDRFDDRMVAPGEFLLGHPNGYGELAYCPSVRLWVDPLRRRGPESRFAMNGSYLAVRQLVQHIDRFRAFERDHPGLAEKLVGRRKDGTPLVECPAIAPENDAFRYRVTDFDGLQCPRGAHVRRANPRDMLGCDVESGIAASKLHRLLRRGRVYALHPAPCASPGARRCGDPWHTGVQDGARPCAEGLFFMALNADIERQFEFVQQRWIGNRSFADLAQEDDFISGSPAPRAFTVQGLPTGRRHENLERFTEVVGGGYFFVPGIAALRFLATGPAHA